MSANEGGAEAPAGDGPTPVTTQGAVAPFTDQSDNKRNRRRSKPINVDGVRTVNYFRFNEHELEFIADPQREAARAQAIGAFFLGLVITTVANFSFGKSDSEMVSGAWIAMGVMALVATIYFFLQANRLRAEGMTRLKAIKDEHDFS